MDGQLTYDMGAPLIQPGSWNAVSVTNAAAGLWDCVFAYRSRTADVDRFLVRSHLALGDVGFTGGNIVTAIAATTITIRVATYTPAGALADKSFNVSFQELG